MKYIDSEKLIAEIDRQKVGYNTDGKHAAEYNTCRKILNIIDSLQQDQPKGNLEYWLEHFGMPKKNIDNCITQIAQGYGACRYLEGIQHGVEAVNELAKQEQPDVDLEKEITEHAENMPHGEFTHDSECVEHEEWAKIEFRHFYSLGLNARNV